jgi:hypothetical protein
MKLLQRILPNPLSTDSHVRGILPHRRGSAGRAGHRRGMIVRITLIRSQERPVKSVLPCAFHLIGTVAFV